MEIWKDIEGYEGLYQISNFGRVKSLKRKVNNCYNCKRIINERILKLIKDNKGYIRISLSKVNEKKMLQVHRLVAITFIENKDNKSQVNHIDGNPTNNNVNNLEWVTDSENLKHAYRTGLYIFTKEKKQKLIDSRAKRVKQFSKNKIFMNEYYSVREAGRITGVIYSTISACCRGERKSAGGYIWKYEAVS